MQRNPAALEAHGASGKAQSAGAQNAFGPASGKPRRAWPDPQVSAAGVSALSVDNI
jgi:hypothetical protein